MEMKNDGCRCRTPDVTVYPCLGMVYPPRQEWRALFGCDEGLHAGTIFRELDLKFYGGGCADRRMMGGCRQ